MNFTTEELTKAKRAAVFLVEPGCTLLVTIINEIERLKTREKELETEVQSAYEAGYKAGKEDWV